MHGHKILCRQRNLKVFFLLLFSGLLTECGKVQGPAEEEMPALYPPPVTAKLNLEGGYEVHPVSGDSIFPLIGPKGDTIPTGTPVPAGGMVTDLDTVPQPFLRPAGIPKSVRAPDNVFEIPGNLKVIPYPDSLRNVRYPVPDPSPLINSLGDTLPTGIPLPIRGRRVSCRYSEPSEALPPVFSERARYTIRHLDETHGLNSTYVTCILKDQRGMIWFGTQNDGVCSYDGNTFVHFTAGNGLTGDDITDIMEDQHGHLWFVSRFGGICRYDGESFIHYTEREGMGGPRFEKITEDVQGNAWVTTFRGVVSKISGDSVTHYAEEQGFPDLMTFTVMGDRKGNLWIGSYSHLRMFNGHTYNRFPGRFDFATMRNNSLFEDSRGNIWTGSDAGSSILVRFDGTSITHFSRETGLTSPRVNAIAEDTRGQVWIGTREGANRYGETGFSHFTVAEGMGHDHVLSILDDGEGHILFGTHGGGVEFYKQDAFAYLTEETGFISNDIRSIAEDRDGNLWFGTAEHGAVRFDGTSYDQFTEEEGLNCDWVGAMLKDRNDRLWIAGTNGGVAVYDGEYFSQFPWGHPLGVWDYHHVFEDSRGNIWISMHYGVIRYCRDSTEYFNTETGLTHNNVQAIIEDRNRNIWLTSLGGGVSSYDGESFVHYTEREGLSCNRVTSAMEDLHGRLWFGTLGGGISIFDGQCFTYLTSREGLTGDHVTSLLSDSLGNVWISTLNGLNYIQMEHDPEAGTALYHQIHSFDHHDLFITEYTPRPGRAFLDSKNRIWWGSREGLTMVDMNTFELPDKAPSGLRLIGLDIKGQFLDFRNLPDSIQSRIEFDRVEKFTNFPVNLKVPHKFNHLTFHLSAIDWVAPHKIKYSYKMEGLDDQWSNPSHETLIDYRNLPRGTHLLKVRAIGAAMIWSEPFEYRFTVQAPWWFSWWAWVGYVLFLAFGAFQYRNFLIRRERLKSMVEMERLEKEKILELDRMKSRFFANISHEFRTPLTLLLGPLEDMLRNRKDGTKGDREMLTMMQTNARKLLRLINQLLDLSKLETGRAKLSVTEGNLEEFVRIIIQSFLSLAERRNIRCRYFLPGRDLAVFFDRDKIEKILTNLISNAFKFTPEGGEVKVTMIYPGMDDAGAPSRVVIKVADTGRGIPSGLQDKVFDRFYQVNEADNRDAEGTGIGLALVKELVEVCRGEINLESEQGEGSAFTVDIPVSRAAFEEDEVEENLPEQMPSHRDPGGDPKGSGVTEIESESPPHTEADNSRPLVLIAEDNADLRKYVSVSLGNGYQIIQAENGRMGLERAIEHIPDLVISDVMMPGMDGMEMCARLKQDDRTSHIPVVMLTAKADRESRMEGLETGADDYLIKPFDAGELQVRVKNLIEQRRKLRTKLRKQFMPGPDQVEVFAAMDAMLQKVIGICEKHIGDAEFTIDDLGSELHMSRAQVYRKVSAVSGSTPNELLRMIRLKKAARLLGEGEENVTQVMYQVGYRNLSFFARSFRRSFGVNPSEYRNRQRNKQ